jgi:hypothetical protein
MSFPVLGGPFWDVIIFLFIIVCELLKVALVQIVLRLNSVVWRLCHLKCHV